MSEDKKYTPQQEKEIDDYLTRPPTPMEPWVKNTTANNADPGSFKKAVTMSEHIQKNLDMFETPEPKPKKVTEDKRDFNDKRGKRFINKTTTAVENPNIEEKPKRKKIDDSKNGDYFTFCRNKKCNQPLYKNRSNMDTRYCMECL